MTEHIEIRGARENNLRDVSIDIPKRRITVFTGVSGSGKSSLVFGTIAAESQRLLHETLPTFVQTFLPKVGQPDADSLKNISASIVVNQERIGGNSRSTVGTVTDTATMLRLLFARLGEPAVASPGHLSFNDPRGMCTTCEGIGMVSTVDLDAVVDRSKSLAEGALLPQGYGVGTWFWQIFAQSGFFDVDKKIRDYSEEELHKLLYLPEAKVKIATLNMNSKYEGLVPKLKRLLGQKDVDALQPHVRAEFDRIFTRKTCDACGGARLNAAALACRVRAGDASVNIADAAAMQVTDLLALVRSLEAPKVAPLVQAIALRLEHLVVIGLGYLSLDRESATLSGGESQRTKMVRHLGSSLTDITYVFDEPSTGLHPHDIGRMGELLKALRDKGNTVLVVEHKPDVINIADHVVDMGPGAGHKGGTVVYEGPLAGLLASGTLTGKHMERRRPIKASPRKASGAIAIDNARLHNLKDVSVQIPRGVLTAVTGVAGSGKSSLILGCLPKAVPDAVVIDQSLGRGSRRSNTLTYTGALDAIRKAFAKANGVDASLFSANSKGACPECGGLGVVYTELAHLEPVGVVCDTCNGKRFTDEVLGYALRGKTIGDVYALAVDEAATFFTEKALRGIFQGLVDVGLGYLTLGQPVSTLSGGERQRLKVASELGEAGASRVYVLDEPTSGLHMNDVERLIGLLDRLVDAGSTVVVIEHNLDVVAAADWIIDMGPGAGHDGGTVVFEGHPAALARHAASLTGQHLARHV